MAKAYLYQPRPQTERDRFWAWNPTATIECYWKATTPRSFGGPLSRLTGATSPWKRSPERTTSGWWRISERFCGPSTSFLSRMKSRYDEATQEGPVATQ